MFVERAPAVPGGAHGYFSPGIRGIVDKRITGAMTPPLRGAETPGGGAYAETWLELEQLAQGREDAEIEEFIIDMLTSRHGEWISAAGAKRKPTA